MTRSLNRSQTLALLALLILCAACSNEAAETVAPATPEAVTPPPAATPAQAAAAAPAAASDARVAVDGEGLRLVALPSGAARPIPFGAPQAEVLATLERLRGPAGQGTNEDCGVQYAAWPDGLSLYFESGRFAGWALDGRAEGAVTTMSGVGPGAHRATLDAYADLTVSQTTLGREFLAGGMAGLLDGPGADATITDLWAGRTCIAR